MSLAVLTFSFFDRHGQERMQWIAFLVSLADANTLLSVASITVELSVKGSEGFYRCSIVYRIIFLASLSHYTFIFSNGDSFLHYFTSYSRASTFTVVNTEMHSFLIAKVS